MIDERLKGVDQDKIRQEMQVQAKQRATEPLAVEGNRKNPRHSTRSQDAT